MIVRLNDEDAPTCPCSVLAADIMANEWIGESQASEHESKGSDGNGGRWSLPRGLWVTLVPVWQKNDKGDTAKHSLRRGQNDMKGAKG